MNPSRLPVVHPDYRYPASKNPYWAKLQELAGKVFSDNETESHAGNWRAYFTDLPENVRDREQQRELHVELGCNAGHVTVEWARLHPRNAYIGLDWKFKAIFRGLEKAEKKGAKNLLFFRAHAERINYMFGPGEIDHLYLFFPDPWAKKSQWKHRYFTPPWLREVAKILKPGGVFHIRTDHAGYFEWMESAVEETKDLWEVTEKTRDRHAGNPNAHTLIVPDVTLFEKIFIRQGLPIHAMKLRRKS